MKKTKNLILLFPLILVFTMLLVSAGDFKIDYGGATIFTVATSGNTNISGTIAENGVLLSETYLALAGGTLTGNLLSDNYNMTITGTGYFVGDGSYLTGISTINATYAAFATDGVTIKYQNISNIPTCDPNEHLDFDGSALTCTLDVIAPNTTTITYQNITTWPTCGAGEHLDADGSTLSCTADAGSDFASLDALNVAFTNITNTWAEDQIFSKDLNVTGSIRLMTNDSAITGILNSTNISIDSSGNVIIRLG